MSPIGARKTTDGKMPILRPPKPFAVSKKVVPRKLWKRPSITTAVASLIKATCSSSLAWANGFHPVSLQTGESISGFSVCGAPWRGTGNPQGLLVIHPCGREEDQVALGIEL